MAAKLDIGPQGAPFVGSWRKLKTKCLAIMAMLEMLDKTNGLRVRVALADRNGQSPVRLK
jgi:hypothetical protein